jgi:hypothetical protein
MDRRREVNSKDRNMVQNITFDKGDIVGSIQPLLRASLLKIKKKKKHE